MTSLYPKTFLFVAAALACTFVSSAHAQYRGYNPRGTYTGPGNYYGGGFGGAGGRGITGGYGYGGVRGYGSYYPTYLYRSPSSFTRQDDPYHTETSQESLERSLRRFRELRRESRSAEESYSNKTYNRYHPFDQSYYNRMMTP